MTWYPRDRSVGFQQGLQQGPYGQPGSGFQQCGFGPQYSTSPQQQIPIIQQAPGSQPIQQSPVIQQAPGSQQIGAYQQASGPSPAGFDQVYGYGGPQPAGGRRSSGGRARLIPVNNSEPQNALSPRLDGTRATICPRMTNLYIVNAAGIKTDRNQVSVEIVYGVILGHAGHHEYISNLLSSLTIKAHQRDPEHNVPNLSAFFVDEPTGQHISINARDLYRPGSPASWNRQLCNIISGKGLAEYGSAGAAWRQQIFLRAGRAGILGHADGVGELAEIVAQRQSQSVY